MIDLVLKRAVEEYKENLAVILSMAVLLIFPAIFTFLGQFFKQFFFSSGSVLLSFNTEMFVLVGLVVGLVFLYVFSFFVSLIVYTIKKDVQSFSIDVYWNMLLKNAAIKIFILYTILAIIFYALSFFGIVSGFSVLAMLISFLIAALVMYAPQSIVLDEETVFGAIVQSAKFWKKNPAMGAVIIVLGSVMLAIILAVEYLLEMANFPGIFVSFLLVLIVLIPFIELMKSYAFVLKFDLIRTPEIYQSRARPYKTPKINALRMREKPRHGNKI
jgi:hypothetical protein